MKYLYQYLLFFVLLNSCHTKGQNENFGNSMDVKEVVPEGFCPFICQDNGMYITGLLNDTIDICLLFDTGADALLLDSSFACSNHLTINPKIKVNMIDAKVPVQICSDKTSLNLCSKHYDFEIIPIFNQRRIFGDRIDGTIGWMPFREKKIHINFNNKYYAITDVISDSIKNVWHSIDLIQYKYRFYVPANINFYDGNQINGFLMVDFGESGAFSATSTAFRNIKVSNDKRLSFVIRNSDVKGTSRVDIIKCSSIRLGEIVFVNPYISVPDIGRKESDEINIIGKIGYEALSALGEIILDFKEKKLFYPQKQSNNITFKNFITTGIMFVKDSKSENNIITAVGTQLTEQIEIGDIVLEIDGHNPNEKQFDIQDYVMSHKGKDITYKIQKKNGNIQYIKLSIQKL